MANTQTISNEEIIAAMLQHGTIKEAAAATGTTPRTIYDRMKKKDFRAAYMEAKNDIFRKAVFSINEKLTAAIDAIVEIMSNPDNSPAVRLRAAEMILANAEKFATRLAREETDSRHEGQSSLEKSMEGLF